MFKHLIPRASASRQLVRPANLTTSNTTFAASRSTSLLQNQLTQRRSYATPTGKLHFDTTFTLHVADILDLAEEKDLVIIGGGVAGYVAAIKAGQEGLKVRIRRPIPILLLHGNPIPY